MLMKVKFTQSCPTLYEPMDSIVHGILQARILEWVAFPFSRGSLNPGIKPRSPALQADSLPAELQGKPISSSMYPQTKFLLSLQTCSTCGLRCLTLS